MPCRYWPQIILFSAFLVAGGCARQESNCQSSEQCGPTMICVEARCIVPCSEDAVCGEGVICVAGNCQIGCREHDDCPLGTLCEADQCINGCVGRNRCEAYQFCSDQGQCLNGCGRDGDCGAGQFCEDDKCVPIGGADAGQIICQRNEQCRVGEFCAPEGRCRVGCRPATCPPAQTCDPQTGRCSGAAAPPDAGPLADAGAQGDGGGGFADAGPDNTFQLTCSLSLQGQGVDALQVRADGLLQVEIEPDLPAVIVWERLDSPGQTDSVIWGPAAGREQLVALQRVGQYRLRASAQVGDHVEHCELRVSGRAPARGTWIELAWNGDRDLDLHLVPIPNQEPCEQDEGCAQNQLRRLECNQNYCSRRFSSRDGRDGDCWARNSNPLWGDVNDRPTNPHYLGDVVRGAGTENITLGALITGWNYRLALRAWGDEPNEASLKIYTDGRSVYDGAVLRIAPATPNPWLYVGRLSADGFVEVLELSASYPRN